MKKVLLFALLTQLLTYSANEAPNPNATTLISDIGRTSITAIALIIGFNFLHTTTTFVENTYYERDEKKIQSQLDNLNVDVTFVNNPNRKSGHKYIITATPFNQKDPLFSQRDTVLTVPFNSNSEHYRITFCYGRYHYHGPVPYEKHSHKLVLGEELYERIYGHYTSYREHQNKTFFYDLQNYLYSAIDKAIKQRNLDYPKLRRDHFFNRRQDIVHKIAFPTRDTNMSNLVCEYLEYDPLYTDDDPPYTWALRTTY